MSKSDLKLLTRWSSPYGMRARIALKLKSIEYEYIEEIMFPKSDLLVQSNPVHKKVPVLFHGDRIICESLLIVEYVDEFWPSSPSILPSNPFDRAVARFWAAYIDKWFPNVKSLMIAEGAEAKKPFIQNLKEGVVPMEEAYVNCSKGKNFFGGDCIGYIDIAFGSFLPLVSAVEKIERIKVLDEEKTPALVKWAERFLADEAVKDLLPDIDKVTELFRSLIARWRGLIPNPK